MMNDSITCGESYAIATEARDSAGAPLVMAPPWAAACRVIRLPGNEIILDEVAMTLSEGIARIEIDTGDAPWTAGLYRYDVRLTDPEGNDFWSEPVQLRLNAGITPKST